MAKVKAAAKRAAPAKKPAPKKPAAKKSAPKKTPKRRTRPTKALQIFAGDGPEMDPTKALATYVKESEALMQFVKDNLEEGIDYGPMWEASDKSSIYKAGCERVNNWLQLKDVYFPDLDSWNMLGNPEATLCFNCYLIRRQDAPHVYRIITEQAALYAKQGVEIPHRVLEESAYKMIAVSEGKGAATYTNLKSRIADANVAVKKGRIRAYKDATLGLGLSNRFTQDFGSEDPAEGGEDFAPNPESAQAPPKKKKVSPGKSGPTLEELQAEGLQLVKKGAYVKDTKLAQAMEQNILRLFEEKNLPALSAVVQAARRKSKQGA